MNSPEHAKFLAEEWLESWADSGLEWRSFPTSSLMAHLAASAMAPPVRVAAPEVATAATAGEAVPPAVTLSVIFVVPAQPSAAALALLSRMILAMGLDSTDIGLVLATNPQVVCSLSKWDNGRQAAGRSWVGLGATHDSLTLDLQTHSLEEVLANPALKKPVWEGLQKIMHKLGLR
jgi:hypothetical protein